MAVTAETGRHAQGQRSLERYEGVGAPPTEQHAQGPPKPQLQQPWPAPGTGMRTTSTLGPSSNISS